MEKAFRIESNAQYYIDIENYLELVKNQREQVKEFLKTHGIEAIKYRVGGNGSVNQPFKEYWKDEIVLGILPTIDDKHNYATMLRKPYDSGICDFKKKSKINKKFQNYCIENEVVINLSQPELREYLKSLDWKAYRTSIFKYNDCYYLTVESNLLKNNDVPEGFIEIKMSEFYLMKDEFESEGK